MIKIRHVLFFLLVSLVALGLLDSPGTFDVNKWMEWLHNVETYGIVSGFKVNHEAYPPLSSSILFIVAKVSRLFQVDVFIGFKLSLAVFLLLTSIAFFIWTKNLFITTLMQLTLILNSMALGYIDIYFAPTLILSLWALKTRNLLLFTVLFSITCLIKWQPIIIAPFFLIYILNIKKKEDWKQIDFKSFMKLVLFPFLLIFAFVLYIFGSELLRALERAISDPFLSGLALNFNWVLTYLLHIFYPDTFGSLAEGHWELIMTNDLRIVALPRLIFFALYTVAFVALLKRNKTFENVILYSLAGFLAYFMFNTGVHENHLFLASILAIILFWIDRSYLSAFVIWSLIANINLFIFYGVDGKGISLSRFLGVDFTFLFSIIIVLLFVAFFAKATGKKIFVRHLTRDKYR